YPDDFFNALHGLENILDDFAGTIENCLDDYSNTPSISLEGVVESTVEDYLDRLVERFEECFRETEAAIEGMKTALSNTHKILTGLKKEKKKLDAFVAKWS